MGAGFLRYKVMVVLLEEEQAERESLRRHGSPADTMSFSDGSSRLNTKIPFLYGRADVLQNQSDPLTDESKCDRLSQVAASARFRPRGTP